MCREILQNIINNFSPQDFISFFRKKSRVFSPKNESFSHYNNDFFTEGSKLGEIKFSESEKLIVCAFQACQPLSERSGKKSQYEKGKEILKETQSDSGIFIFYDKQGNFRFSLIYPETIGNRRLWNNFRRFTYFVCKEFTNKTFIKRMEQTEFSSFDKVKEAFALGPVTDIFYNEFFVEYKKLVDAVKEQNGLSDQEKARDFVLLFSIRTIFLGFIQKKYWIGNDEKFIQNFLKEYTENYFGKNLFYKKWLAPLFFEALNSPPGNKVSYSNNDFSKETEEKLLMAPYLNGGLFKKRLGYDDEGYFIPDKEIKDFFDFLFSHNFTIEENSYEDEDLQLNPEFLGIIFERLVNKADGAVYTPRTEVDFMCRLSLVKWLIKNLDLPIQKSNLYELFFREGEKEEDQKYGSFSEKEIQIILDLLENITICDPAVGSGAFLVGIMRILDEIEQNLKLRIGITDTNTFERKKRIISKSLYGIEVKEWAVWICQLRLWLSLFIDAPDQMKTSFKPILPSLDFKVRQGDSLVQRIGHVIFPISGHAELGEKIKKQVTQLKKLKNEYFSNENNEDQYWTIRQRELSLYSEILQNEIQEKRKELKKLTNDEHIQTQLIFEDFSDQQTQQEVSNCEKTVEKYEEELKALQEQKKYLNKNKPLIWNIEFAEIFAEKKGFDIIIGNPPYVRHEDITDPTGIIKEKKQYKEFLAEMVRLDFPKDFPPKSKIDAKSDLYTYFYIRSLCLLNTKGIHTFICSNSWLDVGYGSWLQKFLLERAPVELIIDNHAKRSFEAADVNTIISIIHAPQKSISQKHVVKFVAFKKSFDEAVFTEYLLQIEEAKDIVSNDIFRLYPISVKALKEAGTEYENEEDEKMEIGKYTGDKWGGKYLRAPKFVLDILNSSKVKPFLELIDIKYGVKPGKVKFFYLDQDKINEYEIEKEFLTPAIISSQYINRIFIKPTHFIFSCLKSKQDLKGTGALKYIEWGEANDMNQGSSVEAHRPFWYSLLCDNVETIFFQFWDKRFFSPIAEIPMTCSNNFCYGNFKGNDLAGKIIINSTFYYLQIELFGNSNQGQGILTTYKEYDYPFIRMPIIKNDNKLYEHILNILNQRDIKNIFEECGIDPKSEIPIEEQEPKPLPDRAELDKIIFDALELTEKERKDVYRAICRLVWNRINKAKSV